MIRSRAVDMYIFSRDLQYIVALSAKCRHDLMLSQNQQSWTRSLNDDKLFYSVKKAKDDTVCLGACSVSINLDAASLIIVCFTC